MAAKNSKRQLSADELAQNGCFVDEKGSRQKNRKRSTHVKAPDRVFPKVESKNQSGRVVVGKSKRKYYEIDGKRIAIPPGSFLDRVSEAIGIVKDSPSDASTNKAYLEGFGR